ASSHPRRGPHRAPKPCARRAALRDTRRRSASLSPWCSFAGLPEIAEPGRDDIRIPNILVENAHADGKTIDRRHRFLADRGVVEGQIAAEDAGDQPGLARREALVADLGGLRDIRL